MEITPDMFLELMGFKVVNNKSPAKQPQTKAKKKLQQAQIVFSKF